MTAHPGCGTVLSMLASSPQTFTRQHWLLVVHFCPHWRLHSVSVLQGSVGCWCSSDSHTVRGPSYLSYQIWPALRWSFPWSCSGYTDLLLVLTFLLFQAAHLWILLLLIPCATPSSSNTDLLQAQKGLLSQHPHKRLSRSSQTFGNSFDPIPADEVRDHFATAEHLIYVGLDNETYFNIFHMTIILDLSATTYQISSSM